MFARVLFVGFGGMIGTILRYGVYSLVQRFDQGRFPTGTLLVNTAGCLVAGFLFSLSEQRAAMSHDMRLFVFVGILGGFTTFSAFGFETFSLLHDGLMLHALTNIAFHLVLALGAVWVGYGLARVLV